MSSSKSSSLSAIGSVLWLLSPFSLWGIPLSDVDAELNQEKKVVDLQAIVVTTQRERFPLQVELDAGAVIQPMPAQDGADYLKHIPGFSIIRKGGIDGDPVLRGVGGSRLSISVDGETLLGGCGQRMDPPTAYVFPTGFDRVIVTKGPQTVMYGPGNSAGVVRFERDLPSRDDPRGASGNVYANLASFGRFDVGGAHRWQGSGWFTRFIATHSRAEDYETGDGESVHSSYERWSSGLSVGWMPTDADTLELTVNTSDGEAAYADRAMDGIKFARENAALRYRKRFQSDLIEDLDAQVYYNDVDHVMDNFSLRNFTASAMMPNPAVSNPDRLTYGGKVAVKLVPSEGLHLDLGIDAQVNEHSIRKTMNQNLMAFEHMERMDDAKFEQLGVFAEARSEVTEDWILVWGGRVDFWSAEDLRDTLAVTMMGSFANPTAGAERSDTLPSGFLRLEHPISQQWGQVYAGVGYVQRFPDYWELFSKESATELSAFEMNPESTVQLDVGWLREREHLAFSVSAFLADHSDFILVQSGYLKPAMMGKNRSALIARNIDASTIGVEVSLLGKLANGLYSSASLAYVKGENDTDNLPLAQIPPLEARIELGFKNDIYSTGLLVRIVDKQDRVAINQGNIVGQDIGTSDGFTVCSLHGSYRVRHDLVLSAGVDNLFDEAYAEHLSRAGGAIAGFTQTTRVMEPGSVYWIRADFRF